MRRLILVLLAAIAVPLAAQQQGNPPRAISIDSKVLGETRNVLVRTPASYGGGARAYPVLYMTDGDRQIEHTVALADYLVREGRMPETIVVGISNTDRTRDLTPTHVATLPTSGGAGRFLEFIAAELIPHIEKSYRTQPYRLLAGHSFGGLFALHALFSRPDLFHAVIAVSPSLIWDDQYVMRHAREFTRSTRELNRTIVFTVGNEGAQLDREFDALHALLKRRAPKGFEVEAIRFDDEDHGSVVLPSHYAALRKIFEPWRFPLDGDVKTLFARATRHYDGLSQRIGFAVPVPEATTNAIGYRLLQQEQVAEAIEVFRANAAAYPASANVYDSLAEACERAGDLKAAKENYARAAKLGKETSDPNTAVYEQNLARVTRALAVKEVSRLGGTIEMEGDAIVKIDLHETGVTDGDLHFLRGLTSLRYLDLRLTGVGDTAAEHVAGLANLETMNFFRTRLSDAGLRKLAALTSLRTLLIGGTRITDEGLASLSEMKQLRKLSVFGTGVSDAGLVHLRLLPRLEVLLLGGSRLTEEAARSALPRVRFSEPT
ncbi:MAG TPA: alpha/beta hydrolase-fold protein [Thermoanaerobaculia bacterium]|nr:alpha/beta hydrolase-fold protein [Thermoanaerobaculia bacterium]